MSDDEVRPNLYGCDENSMHAEGRPHNSQQSNPTATGPSSRPEPYYHPNAEDSKAPAQIESLEHFDDNSQRSTPTAALVQMLWPKAVSAQGIPPLSSSPFAHSNIARQPLDDTRLADH